MYQSPIIAHGFNHQLLYRQPVSNLRQINEIVLNRKNETQHIGSLMPHTYATIANQQFIPGYANSENQFYSSLKDPNEVQIQSSQAAVNHQENGLSHLPQTMMTGYSSARPLWPMNRTSDTTQDRLLTRQSSLGTVAEAKNVSSQETVPLSNSRSAGAIQDYIQKERRAHTMAPLTRIVGPSSSIATTMFASTTAPSDAQTMKSSYASQTISNAPFHSYPQSNTEMIDAINNDHKVDVKDDGEEKEEDDDDDDTPIIVKVQYDPDAGGPPSEDIIRQAVDNQLKWQPRPKNTNEPIVLNFLNRPTQPEIPSMRVKPQQPFFNRSAPSIPQLISPPQQQQQQQQQQSLFQQQLKQQQQQQLQLQEKQRQQQKQEQQRRQQEFLLEQQEQKQEQQRRLQEFLLEQQEQKLQQLRQQEFLLEQQEQKQKLQQYLQRQYQLDQQRKEEQIRQERLQWEQQQIQKKLKAEQKEIGQLIQQQLLREQQQLQRKQQQQRYRQLFQQQQQQERQKQQESQQQNRQIYQSHQNESEQKNASLPPIGPRPWRTIPAIRTIPTNKLPPIHSLNNYTHPTQTVSQASMPLRNPSQFSTITTQNNRNTNSKSINDSVPSGLNAYNGYFHQQIPNIFRPIQFKESSEQPFSSLSGTNMNNTSQNFLQRSNTAPSSTEMFRPSSAFDIPELSKENLQSMLNRIPDLSGRRFSIEYAEPTGPVDYPIPSLLDNANTKYPEAVIVDKLPTNIIQHVRRSDNIELKTALNIHVPSEKTAQSNTKSQPTSLKLKQPSSKVLHHSTRLKQRVKQSRPILSTSSDDYDSSTETITLDEETEVEAIEIEIVPLSKHRNYY